MQLLTQNEDMLKTINKLMSGAKKIRLAVAWASESCPLFNKLKKQPIKIEQMVIGIHFYQTDPKFIKAFIDHEGVRFKMNPSGVFHPKIYLFEQQPNKWDCVIGSSNFTKAAFYNNDEVSVHISQEDDKSGHLYNQIDLLLNGYFNSSKRINTDELEEYNLHWTRRQRQIEKLSGQYSSTSSKSNNSPLETKLFNITWTEYFNWVRIDPVHSTEERLDVLEEAHRILSSDTHFKDLPYESRRAIAGLAETEQHNWLLFGSMKGSGKFRKLIKDNNLQLSLALDTIPLNGQITKENFDNYLDIIHPILGENPIATATRLLALKRPDYFICLDSKNLESFKECFGIKSKIHITNYWNCVIERILDSNWWNSPEPQAETLDERRIWRCRTAFLDVPLYKV